MANIMVEYKVGFEELRMFKETGNFKNNFDSFGNLQLVFNNKTPSGDSDGTYYYSNISLKTLDYDSDKIEDTTSVQFNELQSTKQEQAQNIAVILQRYNEQLAENRILNETVNALIEKYENNDDKQVIAAMKNEIIDLRIKLDQGNVPSDFDDSFPFLPLT
jgi:hypothetical protein